MQSIFNPQSRFALQDDMLKIILQEHPFITKTESVLEILYIVNTGNVFSVRFVDKKDELVSCQQLYITVRFTPEEKARLAEIYQAEKSLEEMREAGY